jgi:hypothetical protein
VSLGAGSYPRGMVDAAAQEFLRRFATDDVRSTVRWLVTSGYTLGGSEVGASDWFALFIFKGDGPEVHIGVERSQWFMQIKPVPGNPPVDYDLLVVTQRGQTYWDVFPDADIKPRTLPRQLPPGLSWHESLPDVLAWIACQDVTLAVARAQDQRYVVMWPASDKAKRLRRTWRADELPTPGQE